MLEEIRESYLAAASFVPGWQSMNKNDLINKCLDYKISKDIDMYEATLSAIILRYWGNIGKYYTASKASGFSIEDCYDWLIHAITYALDHATWRDPNNKLFTDKYGPDKVVNRCIYSTRKLNYYLANRDVRRANFGKDSLDKLSEAVGDHLDSLSDTILDSTNLSKELELDSIVRIYMNNDELLKGIIVNSIYYDNPFTVDFKFKPTYLANALFDYTVEDQEYLADKYKVDKDKVFSIFADVKTMSKDKLVRVIKKVMSQMTSDQLLKDYLA